MTTSIDCSQVKMPLKSSETVTAICLHGILKKTLNCSSYENFLEIPK